MAYHCRYCGLHYESKKMAEACYEHCTKYNSCSMEITKNSLERRGKK